MHQVHEETSRIHEILKEYAPEKGNLMAVLHKIQKECGNWLPEDVLKEVSKETGIPLNKLYGFISYYTMFSTEPRGKHIIRVCKDGPCKFNGAEEIMDLLMKELDIDFGETTEDGLFTLEETACIGTCTAAPAIMIDETIYAGISPEKLADVLKKYR